MKVGWNFPSNNFAQLNGISEAGIETFRGQLYSSLAREICQNSLDAVLEINDPVTVEFKKIYIDSCEIPGYEELRDALERCLEFWSSRKNEKATTFFEKSCNEIKEDKVCVLRISDFNTIGLTGSDKEYEITPWQSLVKSSGVSDKSGTSGGSFGIGKSAPFACSDMRTLFYSTRDIDGLVATQGVARIVSFKDKNDQITQGMGYYGNIERNTPLKTDMGMDQLFDRDERTGTDIYIIGFMEESDWKEEMVSSVLDGFLLSIYNNKLIVKIEDIIISKESLPVIIDLYKERAKHAYNYYQVLTSEESVTITKDFGGLGEIELKVLISKNLHRKVLVTRSTGMKIFDKQHISRTLQFAAILILKGDGVNRFFREMESPQHDAWEPDRHSDKKSARKRRTELFRLIKEEILNLGRNTSTDELDAEGVGEFLPDELHNMEITENKDLEETITEKTKHIDIKIVDKMMITQGSSNVFDIEMDDEAMTTGSSTDNENGDGETKKPTGNSNTTSGGSGTKVPANEDKHGYDQVKKYIKVGVAQTRLILIDNIVNKYKLIITPQKNISKGFIKISLSGEQSNVEANVVEAYNDENKSQLKCSQGKIFIEEVNAFKRLRVDFILDYLDNCSMEVELYGHKV